MPTAFTRTVGSATTVVTSTNVTGKETTAILNSLTRLSAFNAPTASKMLRRKNLAGSTSANSMVRKQNEYSDGIKMVSMRSL